MILLPTVRAGMAFTLTLSFGQTFLGWSAVGASSTRPGPAMSLVDSTVALRAFAAESERAPFPSEVMFDPCPSSPPLSLNGTAFTVAGVVTDAAGGVATFALTASHLRSPIALVLEPTATFEDGRIIVPDVLSLMVAGAHAHGYRGA